MNLVADIITYITQTLGGLLLGAVILRFFLQIARADFYNPFSQGIVKVTNPLLKPLRRVIPGVWGIDIAAIVLALLIQFVLGEFNFFVMTQQLANPLYALLFGLLGTLKLVTFMLFGVCIILVVSSFVAPYSSHPIILLSRQLLEPLMNPIHRLIPPMGGLDFSILFIFIGNTVIQKVLDAVAFSYGLNGFPLTYLAIGY